MHTNSICFGVKADNFTLFGLVEMIGAAAIRFGVQIPTLCIIRYRGDEFTFFGISTGAGELQVHCFFSTYPNDLFSRCSSPCSRNFYNYISVDH